MVLDEAIQYAPINEETFYETFPAFVYRPHSELIAAYDALVAQYPTIAKKYIIGTSIEGRQIPFYTFGKGGGRILLDSCMHGGEDIGAELFLMWLRDNILPQNSSILTTCIIGIVPVVNIDRTGRTNPHYVNINRNFATAWSNAGQLPYCKAVSPTHYSYNPMVGDPDHGYPRTWTAHGHVHNFLPFQVLPSTWACPVCGAVKSTFSNPENWRGPSAASEPETQALINVFKTWKPHLYCNNHHFDYYIGSYYRDTVVKNRLISIRDRIIALGQAQGVTPIPWQLWSGYSPGFACSDAYAEGALSILIEWAVTTPPTTELPNLLLKWNHIGQAFAEAVGVEPPSNGKISFPIIVASLEVLGILFFGYYLITKN